MSKQCKVCEETKPFDAFYVNKGMRDGHLNRCKACESLYQNTPEKRAKRNEHQRRPENKAKKQKQPYNKQYMREYMQGYRKKHPERIFARNKLNKAVKTGKIVRPDDCSICGVKCAPDGHHEDYSKPLEVDWLCRLCHTAVHLK